MGFDTEEFDYLEDNKSKAEVIESLPKIAIKVKPVIEVKEEEAKDDAPKFETDSLIFIVKVTTNKESKAVELISDKVKKKGVNIYSIVKPHGLRGYLILEAPDKENAEEAVFNLPYVKGIISKQVSYEEIKKMIEPRASDVKIEKNDIVEIISDSFKNEKAKVLRVDKTKGEAVVSLLAAIVPIPVTVRLDNIRVIRREDEEIQNS
jgi:transcriptional antiterminator NusG